MTQPPTRADVVIVGAGTAGCIAAEILSRDAGRRVLLIEAGGLAPTPEELVLGRLPVGPGSPRVRVYRTTEGLAVPRGRGLGGSAAVNGGYFLRWHHRDVDALVAAANTPEVFSSASVADAYDVLDGGRCGGGSMSVHTVGDDDLSPAVTALESLLRTTQGPPVEPPWPDTGWMRVRTNRRDGARVTTWAAFTEPALRRPNLMVLTGTPVERIRARSNRVHSVVTDVGEIVAADVLLCAGTFGTAEVLMHSAAADPDVFGRYATLGFGEHREMFVRYRVDDEVRTAAAEPPRIVLPTVGHTDDGCEIRFYNGDFADHIGGVQPSLPAVGVVAMTSTQRGVMRLDEAGRMRIELPGLSADDLVTMRRWAEGVGQMLTDTSMRGIVDPDSVTIDQPIATSQHACGSLPIGTATDALGALGDIGGLRVLDGSLLPRSGHSGPHATVAMVALRIATVLSAGAPGSRLP